MKKIIDGKCYNTETATRVADNGNDWCSDIYFVSVDLYRTRKGAWFKTNFGTTVYTPIEPVTEAEAKKFCEKYASYENYVRYFGEPEEA